MNRPPTPQEVYDRVCAHLAKQACRAMGHDDEGKPRCAYRGQDGTRCAIGALIPDEVYSPTMEGLAGSHDRIVAAVYGSECTDPSPGLLNALQAVHDTTTKADLYGVLDTVDAIQLTLVRVANRFDLTPGAEQAITHWNFD